MPNATTKDWRSWRYDGARGKGSRCETAGYRMAEFIRCRPRRPDSLQVLFRSPRKVLPYLAWLTDVRPALLARGLKTDETGSVDREAVWLGFLGWTENAVRFTRVFCRAALHHPEPLKRRDWALSLGRGCAAGSRGSGAPARNLVGPGGVACVDQYGNFPNSSSGSYSWQDQRPNR